MNKSHIRNLLLEQIPDAVIGLNHDLMVIDFNHEALNFFNLNEEDISKTQLADLIPDGLPNHTQKRFESEARKKDGGNFSVEITRISISDNSESYVYLIIRNITLRKKIAKELQLLTETVENSLNAFDIVDSEGKLVYVNKTYVKMWGYDTAEEILGTPAANHCADPAIPSKIISSLKEKGECNIEFLGLRKDGSTFNVLMWARLAHDPDGKEIYPTTSIDITDRVVAENEKTKLSQQLAEAVKARDEFISICSHELKTPITSMKLQFQLTEKQLHEKNPDVIKEAAIARRVNVANRQLDRMNSLIEDMLDVSKIAAGKLSLNLEKLNIDELVNEVLERLKDHFLSLNIAVQYTNNSQTSLISCDRFRMEQVLQNLLTNAIKYGDGKKIDLEVNSDSKNIYIKVRDYGIGIHPESIDKIFERYERAIPSSQISGLGLGLYISRQIIELHHGHIKVISELGKGSTFIIELPVAK